MASTTFGRHPNGFGRGPRSRSPGAGLMSCADSATGSAGETGSSGEGRGDGADAPDGANRDATARDDERNDVDPGGRDGGEHGDRAMNAAADGCSCQRADDRREHAADDPDRGCGPACAPAADGQTCSTGLPARCLDAIAACAESDPAPGALGPGGVVLLDLESPSAVGWRFGTARSIAAERRRCA